MINFHVTFSRQFGGCYRQIRFHIRLRPKDWRLGDQSVKAGIHMLFRMYAFGPFAVQWS